jgi:NADPH:quinone reductase-like Zn-dependent oxidoreductase
MKAAIRKQYAPPDNLKIENIEKPLPKDQEVLVKVYATTVNRTDCAVLTGKPFIMRFFTGLFKPSSPVPGTDFAGIIEATGKNVTALKKNDNVWGFHDAGLSSQAEYLTISEKGNIAPMPDKISYEEAAAGLEGAHYAYNFINKIKLQEGQQVLINGATGAIGSAMLQFLKSKNIDVTAVCNTKNIELMKSLGADKTIDYTREDFTKDDEKYDVILDAVGKSTFSKCKPVLKEKGIYLSSELGPGAQNPFLALTTPIFSKKRVKFPLPSNIKGSIRFITEMVNLGKFKPVIDQTYPLDQISEAYIYVMTGEKTGNVVVIMGN